MPIPGEAEVEARLQAEDLDAWLRLWQVEQGPAKASTLALMAGVIPAAGDAPLRVLDLCAGPGDAGRAIHARFPKATIDAVDRDLFFIALCRLANRAAGVPGHSLRRDLDRVDWAADLAGSYDVIAVANALHWFTPERLKTLLPELRSMLQPGGVFLMMEPVSPTAAIADAFGSWAATQPPQHRHENWIAFWTRVNALLGYQHMNVRGHPPEGRVGDDLTAVEWVDLARDAGFAPVDILLRDAEKVAIAALRPAAA